jgi:hypothetical protein
MPSYSLRTRTNGLRDSLDDISRDIVIDGREASAAKVQAKATILLARAMLLLVERMDSPIGQEVEQLTVRPD